MLHMHLFLAFGTDARPVYVLVRADRVAYGYSALESAYVDILERGHTSVGLLRTTIEALLV